MWSRTWRSAVGGLGRALITAGVLLLLFVGYQLWGTGIAQSHAQDRLKDDFAAQLAAFDEPLDPATTTTAAPTTTPLTVPAATDTEPADTEPADTEPSDTDPVDTAAVASTTTGAPTTAAPTTAAAPTTKPAPATTVVPGGQAGRQLAGRTRRVEPKIGEVVGILSIPKIGVNDGFVEGTEREDLKLGPGHYIGTPLPGHPGNAGIAGHRTTYGNPFIDLDRLAVGDEIRVRTVQGEFEYRMIDRMIVEPTDDQVLRPTPGRNLLTLTTCHPKFSDAKRLIIVAELVGEPLDPSTYIPPVSSEPLITIPPTTISPSTTSTTSTSTSTSTSTTTTTTLATTTASAVESPTTVKVTRPPRTTTTSTTTTSSTSVPVTTLPASSDPTGDDPTLGTPALIASTAGHVEVGFLSGTKTTWAVTLAWAALCALIWFGAWVVLRRRSTLQRFGGYAVGFVVLFLPALYFCFEQIALLLPEAV